MIAVVTDSTAYLTRAEAVRWGVKVVPLSYTVNGCSYHETYADCNGDYKALIAQTSGQLVSSQTSVTVFMGVFEELLQKGYDILCITISSRLSGTYASALVAARETDRSRITVVDSRQTAGGQYLMVRRALGLIREGKGITEVTDALLDYRERISIAFSVSDMAPLRRSGRLGIVRQSIGTILNFRPLLLCEEGAVVSDGAARGREELIRRLVERVPESATQVIVHCINEERTASAIADRLRRSHSAAAVSIRPVGPVLAIHLGLAAVGVAWACDR